MATVVRSNIRAITIAIRSQLKEKLGLPDERIAICFDSPTNTQADDLIDIIIGPCLAVNPWIGSNGRHSALITRQIGIRISTRLGVDEVGENENWFLDGSLGHLVSEDLVLDALLNFLPVDGGNGLVAEPLQYLQTSQAKKPAQSDQGQPSYVLGWGESIIYFSVTYEADVQQSLIPNA